MRTESTQATAHCIGNLAQRVILRGRLKLSRQKESGLSLIADHGMKCQVAFAPTKGELSQNMIRTRARTEERLGPLSGLVSTSCSRKATF